MKPRKKTAKPCAGSIAHSAGDIRDIIIENVQPSVDGGRYPVKCVAGDLVKVEADIFKDGHDVIAACVQYRKKSEKAWKEAPMVFAENDRWRGEFRAEENTRYLYRIVAWMDPVASWFRHVEKKCPVAASVLSEVLEGLALLKEVAALVKGGDARTIAGLIRSLEAAEGASAEVLKLVQPSATRELFLKYPLRRLESDSEVYELVADRKKAEFGSWYEIFPRSQGRKEGESATFRDCIRRLPEIKEMGFDVLYLTPIHPIGITKRKGPNNSLTPEKNSPGSPWAIGSKEGGHKSVHPDLGTMKDFELFVKKAGDLGIEIALDIAFQCSPDHPYVKEHPEWFFHRPDGTIHYAENPPKKYEDIYPLDFHCDHWRELWDEMKSIILFWLGKGVRIFRIDNPHTKPLGFWHWLIGEVQKDHPEAIFFAEAFTRPKVMKYLAKAGFTQSYTYFTWRNVKWEIRQYLEELTQTEMRLYYRGNLFTNTPDILHEFLQKGGRPAFMIRLILAATLSPSYGIYSGFELCENRAKAPGSEEYLDSEKYQYKVWDWDRPGNIKELVGQVNRLRRENPALQDYDNLEFYDTKNDMILCYGKRTPDLSNIIITVVNLDPFHPQEDFVTLPVWKFDIEEWQTYQMRDLLTGEKYYWKGSRNYVRLDPHTCPAHVFLLKKQAGG
ncbi:MAG TPA: alpha-1,4-glucan--maltose-1-phosphate maltosyltransferase [Candidatus Omnitrophota bacterium]|nr:alpha-1,4-glucan--maltose-1-phosphate maltosyltransferase [Candidatus Omnitrophota bacterium]HQB94914.1 alpha-1,4-glucan--maltose-1-phosphate maltosyltransferase [Candidatus Omnitrophota bacterium]